MGDLTLHFAAQLGHLEIVRLLVEVGADKDQADNQGATPMHIAAEEGHLDIVRFFLESGADSDRSTNQGATAWDLASWGGHQQIADELAINRCLPSGLL